MTGSSSHDDALSDLSPADRIDEICDEFERLLIEGKSPLIEHFLDRVTERERISLRQELDALYREYRYARSAHSPAPPSPILLDDQPNAPTTSTTSAREESQPEEGTTNSLAERPTGPPKELAEKSSTWLSEHKLMLSLVAITVVAIIGWAILRKIRSVAENHVTQLLRAPLQDVPGKAWDLESVWPMIKPLLHQRLSESPIESTDYIKAAIALSQFDSHYFDRVFSYLLMANRRDFETVLEKLNSFETPDFNSDFVRARWAQFDSRELPDRQRLRIAAILAKMSPSAPIWKSKAKNVVDLLLKQNSQSYDTWIPAFSGINEVLAEPLAEVAQEASEPELSRAIQLIAELSGGEILTKLLLDSPGKHFELLLSQHYRIGLDYRYQTILKQFNSLKLRPPHPLKSRSEESSYDDLARRRANGVVALLNMEASDKTGDVLRRLNSPTLFAHLINRIPEAWVEPEWVFHELQRKETSGRYRQMLVLTLGRFVDARSNSAARTPILKGLTELILDDDSGTSAAAEWSLKQWDQQRVIINKLASKHPRTPPAPGEKRNWWIGPRQQRIVLVPNKGKAKPNRLAMMAAEVTAELFQLFCHEKRIRLAVNAKRVSPTSAQVGVSWFQAASFCNWLSEKEGLPSSQWIYIPNEQKQYADGMKIAADYRKRNGYRLPTEQEWEQACRAGSQTSRSYGRGTAMLSHYSEYHGASPATSVQPTKRLRPNAWGLFDMLGNAAEWCHNEYLPIDGEKFIVRANVPRAIRGGSFRNAAKDVHPSRRFMDLPGSKNRFTGFRVVRVLR